MGKLMVFYALVSFYSYVILSISCNILLYLLNDHVVFLLFTSLTLTPSRYVLIMKH